MNKLTVTILALALTLYGVIGFWVNIGNETMNSVLFATIVAALVLAPVGIAISAYQRTKDAETKKSVRSGVISLVLSAVSFAGLAILLVNSDNIGSGKVYDISSGAILALGLLLIVNSACIFLMAVINRNKSHS